MHQRVEMCTLRSRRVEYKRVEMCLGQTRRAWLSEHSVGVHMHVSSDVVRPAVSKWLVQSGGTHAHVLDNYVATRDVKVVRG